MFNAADSEGSTSQLDHVPWLRQLGSISNANKRQLTLLDAFYNHVVHFQNISGLGGLSNFSYGGSRQVAGGSDAKASVPVTLSTAKGYSGR